MPNLKHDPQNPHDLLGRPISEGDIVAWGTTWGRSPALTVAVIDRIRFVDKADNDYGARKEVPRDKAKGYQLILRPLRSTGSATWLLRETGEEYREYRDGPRKPHELIGKPVNVRLVQNVVRLDDVTEHEIRWGDLV